jgi:ribonuclease VapC
VTVAVDTSALIAITREESGWEVIAQTLGRHRARLCSTSTMVELGLVLGSSEKAMRVAEKARLTLMPFDERHMRAAWSAWEQFGRGNHRARLNLGDCYSYATAKVADVPLLFVGGDFTKTDVTPAL